MKAFIKNMKWLAFILCLLTLSVPQMKAQEVDDLQAYLDKIAAEQTSQDIVKNKRKVNSIEIPVGLTVVDLSKFTSYKNRTKVLEVKASVKFTNGTIGAASNFSGGTCLLKVFGGATVVLDSTAGVDAGITNSTDCFAAVGVYSSSTFYQCGDITAPDNGTGIAIWIEGAGGTYNYVSGETNGSISNENGGTVNGVEVAYTLAELQAKIDAITATITNMESRYNATVSSYNTIKSYLTEDAKATIQAKLDEIKNALDEFATQNNTLKSQLQTASTLEYSSLNTQIEQLATNVNAYQQGLSTKLNNVTETIKAKAASDLSQKLGSLSDDIYGLQDRVNGLSNQKTIISSQFGNYYFQYKATNELNANLTTFNNQQSNNNSTLTSLINAYNSLLNNYSIGSVSDAVNFYQSYYSLRDQYDVLNGNVASTQTLMETIQTQFNALEINFPNEEAVFNIRPTNLTEEIQLGYKSNRGFVLTSSGMMQFEQKEGADFYLKDFEGNYIVAISGSSVLTTGTKSNATVWTGRSLNNGNYTIYSKTTSRYLAYNGIKVNSAITANSAAYSWTIEESDLDELQAFLNMLAEEEEYAENENEQNLDTLVWQAPEIIDWSKSIEFPEVPYVIRIVGNDTHRHRWIIPHYPGGGHHPEFHPIYIKKGSHVVFDNVDINDLYGGDHVFYVEGTVEIHVNVTIYVQNWDWFIHVGPNGRVIWHPSTGDIPRIKNEGTFDLTEGSIGEIENRGVVNHNNGTIVRVVNRKTYNFVGGIVNVLHNYGTYYHRGGTALTARNFANGTYTMTGGYIHNTTVNSTDTVFVNYGKFYFRGGIIRGYGSRAIYHGKGAYLYIDGGTFDFTHITHYFIEAHEVFYIRGNYDYGSPLPILLAPSVTIRLLYKWIYHFNIVFIGGRPTPRYPLFYGHDFTLTRNHYQYIQWELPNKRWRWYYKETENTIEPRDEEVYDEDDLQAYLDWLAENQEDESASTEDEPQVLDLSNREIVITKSVVIPVGSHVYIKRGTFVTNGNWTYDNIFYVPSGSTMRFENVTVDVSSSTIYIVNGRPMMRKIFDIRGNVYFYTGFYVKGYLNLDYTMTDDYIPGSVVYIDPAAHIYIYGGRFDNIVFRTNSTVNIYIGAKLNLPLNIYIPSQYYYSGYRILAPCGGYSFTYADLDYININFLEFYRVKLGTDGYIYLIDTRLLGDVNDDGVVNIGDPICLVSWLLGQNPPVFIYEQADVNCDGKLNIADAVGIVQLILKNDAPIHSAPNKGNDCIKVRDASLDGAIIVLNNTNKYTAFSLDVTLPKGNQLESVSMNPNRAPNHQLLYKQLSDDKYRIIGMSMSLEAFEGNDGDLLRLITSGNNMGEMTIDKISFVNMNAQDVPFDDIYSVPTEIKHDRVISGTQIRVEGKSIVIDSENDSITKVYTAAGALYKTLNVKSGHNVFDMDAAGIYIVNNKKVVIK